MAKIITRYSNVVGATLPVGLTTGELAVNIVQRRMFVGGTGGTVELAGLSANTFTGLQSIQTASTTVPPLVITNTSSGDEFRFRPSNGTIQFYDASSTNVQSLEFSSTPFGTHTISLPNASTVLAGVNVQQTFLASNTFNQVTNFVGGISAAGGITFNGIVSANSGVTFASTTDHAGVARFAAGVTIGAVSSLANLDVWGMSRLNRGLVVNSASSGSVGATFSTPVAFEYTFYQTGPARGFDNAGWLKQDGGSTFGATAAFRSIINNGLGQTLTISTNAVAFGGNPANILVKPRGYFKVEPVAGVGSLGGSVPTLTVDGDGGGYTKVEYGDLYLGTKLIDELTYDSVNIIFANPTTNRVTKLTAPNTASTDKTITLPNATGTVALDAAANTFTALQSFTAGISASGGVTFANALSVAGNLNSTGLLNSTGGISAAGGITFNANINLQNAEFIRNTTNGRMDFMPSPSGSGNYGLYTDFTSWGFGARLGTIRSSDQALNVGAVLFDTDCVLLGSKSFAMETGQTIKFVASGPDSNNNTTLQCTVQTGAGKTGNAFVLMDNSSVGYGTSRVPTVSFANPNFFIYSGVSVRNNANDFIRFEHDVNNGRIVSGGTSGINLEPGSGIVGVSGGVSAGAYILNSSGIKALTGTTYTFIATDNGRVLTHDNASGCTVTIPTGLPVGFSTTIIRLNATGRVGFTAASGVTMNTYNGWTGMAGQHASASVVSYATNIFNLSGTLA